MWIRRMVEGLDLRPEPTSYMIAGRRCKEPTEMCGSIVKGDGE